MAVAPQVVATLTFRRFPPTSCTARPDARSNRGTRSSPVDNRRLLGDGSRVVGFSRQFRISAGTVIGKVIVERILNLVTFVTGEQSLWSARPFGRPSLVWYLKLVLVVALVGGVAMLFANRILLALWDKTATASATKQRLGQSPVPSALWCRSHCDEPARAGRAHGCPPPVFSNRRDVRAPSQNQS